MLLGLGLESSCVKKSKFPLRTTMRAFLWRTWGVFHSI